KLNKLVGLSRHNDCDFRGFYSWYRSFSRNISARANTNTALCLPANRGGNQSSCSIIPSAAFLSRRLRCLHGRSRFPCTTPFAPPLCYLSFDPVTLPLADSYHHPCLHHCQVPSKHSLYYLYPLLFFHRQSGHPHTLT